MKCITEELIFNRANSMIEKLIKYFSVEDYTEKTKVHIMEKLFHEFRNKRQKRQYTELFTVKEVNMLLNMYIVIILFVLVFRFN